MIFAARGILSEENRILALDVGVLRRKGEYCADLVAELRAVACDHPQILVGDVVEHHVPGHSNYKTKRKRPLRDTAAFPVSAHGAWGDTLCTHGVRTYSGRRPQSAAA